MCLLFDQVARQISKAKISVFNYVVQFTIVVPARLRYGVFKVLWMAGLKLIKGKFSCSLS